MSHLSQLNNLLHKKYSFLGKLGIDKKKRNTLCKSKKELQNIKNIINLNYGHDVHKNLKLHKYIENIFDQISKLQMDIGVYIYNISCTLEGLNHILSLFDLQNELSKKKAKTKIKKNIHMNIYDFEYCMKIHDINEKKSELKKHKFNNYKELIQHMRNTNRYYNKNIAKLCGISWLLKKIY
jgi:hypothetical protein